MNLSSALQQKIEQIATLQGISPEQFILQAVTEKISSLREQVPNSSDTTSPSRPSSSAKSHLRDQDGILVFDTESLDHIDFNLLIEQSRERDWEQMGL
jgi:hypothetical protein